MRNSGRREPECNGNASMEDAWPTYSPDTEVKMSMLALILLSSGTKVISGVM